MNGEKQLACAVLEGALDDIKRMRIGKRGRVYKAHKNETMDPSSALKMIFGDDDPLYFWCEAADFSKSIIRRTARRNLEYAVKKNRPHFTKEQVDMAVENLIDNYFSIHGRPRISA